MSIEDTARRFVEAMNRRDVDALYEMAHAEYRHIDSEGQVFEGREDLKLVWKSFFKSVSDYAIEVDEVFVSQNTVVMTGRTMGAVASAGESWQTPSACRLVVEGDRVREFQVFADNESMRNALRGASGAGGV
jgi:hypothetical protein